MVPPSFVVPSMLAQQLPWQKRESPGHSLRVFCLSILVPLFFHHNLWGQISSVLHTLIKTGSPDGGDHERWWAIPGHCILSLWCRVAGSLLLAFMNTPLDLGSFPFSTSILQSSCFWLGKWPVLWRFPHTCWENPVSVSVAIMRSSGTGDSKQHGGSSSAAGMREMGCGWDDGLHCWVTFSRRWCWGAETFPETESSPGPSM